MLITGSIDVTDDIFEFMPDYRSYFFSFPEKFLHIESYEQYSKLRFSICDNLKFYEYHGEPDYKITFSSVAGMFLKSYFYSDIAIKKIILFNADKNDESFICDYAEIVLSDEQAVCFDPIHFWGIAVDSEPLPPENAIITVIE